RERREGVSLRLRASLAAGVEHERTDAASHRDLRAHAVRPEAVDLFLLESLGGEEAEGCALAEGARHRADLHVALRIDARGLQHLLQPVHRPRRGSYALVLDGGQIALPRAE